MVDRLWQLLDFLLPLPGSARIIRATGPATMAALLRTTRVDTSTIALAPYHAPAVRAAITRAKFANDPQAAALLAALFDAWAERATLPTLTIPIPLSAHRLRSRGYNQVERVLRASATIPAASIRTEILVRERDTPPQTTLARGARLANMKEAFRVIAPAAVAGCDILLVDDVATTGATMAAARAELARHAPASITCVAFAH